MAGGWWCFFKSTRKLALDEGFVDFRSRLMIPKINGKLKCRNTKWSIVMGMFEPTGACSIKNALHVCLNLHVRLNQTKSLKSTF